MEKGAEERLGVYAGTEREREGLGGYRGGDTYGTRETSQTKREGRGRKRDRHTQRQREPDRERRREFESN